MMHWLLVYAIATATRSALHSENERQQSVNNLWFCKYGSYTVIWSLLCITDVLAVFLAKGTATWSLPLSENGHPWSVNDS